MKFSREIGTLWFQLWFLDASNRNFSNIKEQHWFSSKCSTKEVNFSEEQEYYNYKIRTDIFSRFLTRRFLELKMARGRPQKTSNDRWANRSLSDRQIARANAETKGEETSGNAARIRANDWNYWSRFESVKGPHWSPGLLSPSPPPHSRIGRTLGFMPSFYRAALF